MGAERAYLVEIDLYDSRYKLYYSDLLNNIGY